MKFGLINDGSFFENYNFDYGKTLIIKLLLGENLGELKICPECEKVFFAKYRQRKACSPICTRRINFKTRKKDKVYNRLKSQKSYYKRKGRSDEWILEKW